MLDDKVYNVTELDGAFNSTVAYGEITSVTLITTIGRQTFNNLSNLATVTIEGNNLKNIGTSAFYGCKNLSSITLPDSVETIGDYAFYNCTSLNSITISDCATQLGVYAFRGCSNLTSATIGGNVSALRGTFIGCGKLESVTLPSSITTMDSYTFYGCNNLTSITVSCDFDKNKFLPSSSSYINIPETDLDDDPDNDVHTFTVTNSTASGTFTYTHKYENPTYTWTYDGAENRWTCMAKITCGGCGDEITELGTVTGEITKQSTCSEMGETTYTATFTKPEFSTQTKKVEDIAVDPDAHDWKTEWDCDEDKHWHECALCGAITDESEHAWEMDSVITEATDTTSGEVKYVCSVCNQEKIEVVLPHENSDNTEQEEQLTNLDAWADTIKNVIDTAAEKLKDLVDTYVHGSAEQSAGSEAHNPDTSDCFRAPIILIIAYSSLPGIFKF